MPRYVIRNALGGLVLRDDIGTALHDFCLSHGALRLLVFTAIVLLLRHFQLLDNHVYVNGFIIRNLLLNSHICRILRFVKWHLSRQLLAN